MADEDKLSQAEIESLISQMSGGKSAKGNKHKDQKIASYDFRRPERVGREQIRSIQSLHEAFARNFSVSLSSLLRTIIEVKVTGVDQLTYGEFVFDLENPSCFNLLRAEPLEGFLILDINPSILHPIINRLLGGSKDSGPPIRRPLSEIELRLASKITHLFLSELKHSWDNILPIQFVVDKVESNPQLVQIVPPNEVVVLVSFEVTLGDLRGIINFCIPYNSIERIGNKFTNNGWGMFGKSNATPETRNFIGKSLEKSHVEMVVTLADTKIKTSDLLGLRVGDIITTEKDRRSPLEVSVQGVTKFHVSPGAFKGHKAIQIESVVEKK